MEQNKKLRYIISGNHRYYSYRYNKAVKVYDGDRSDGATCAVDIKGSIPAYDTWKDEEVYVSLSWVIHDQLCKAGKFSDGSRCTNWQASTICSDILGSEKRYFRMIYWWPFTFFGGGGKCREKMI